MRIFSILFTFFLPFYIFSNTIYDFQEKDIKGKVLPLSNFKGKPILIVNVASQCGYTGQYKELQELYSKFEEKGLVVIGFPSNDFGGQEPGSNEEIADFCKLNYKVSFPMMSKISVLGKNKTLLYKYLTENAPQKGEISWNFEKFLISKNGKVVGRYKSNISPTSEMIESKIESILKEN